MPLKLHKTKSRGDAAPPAQQTQQQQLPPGGRALPRSRCRPGSRGPSLCSGCCPGTDCHPGPQERKVPVTEVWDSSNYNKVVSAEQGKVDEAPT